MKTIVIQPTAVLLCKTQIPQSNYKAAVMLSPTTP